MPERPQEAERHGAFRMTPESGMNKQDFIMARLHDEAITVVLNIRVYRALHENMLKLLRELSRIRPAAPSTSSFTTRWIA